MQCENLILPTGLPIPVVGLGTWTMDDPIELKKAMESALANGYRHFDTANAYNNEDVLGEVFESWFRDGIVKREDLFITTKLPLAGVHPNRVEMFLNKSLKSLRLEYVDLYLIHFPVCVKYDESTPYPVNELGELVTEPTDHIAVWKKMEEQVRSGKTKSIGLSNFTQRQITRILEHAKIKPAVLQVEVHLYFQNKELVKFCQDQAISVVAYSPLGSPGLNKYCKKKGWPTSEVPNVMADPILVSIANKYSKSQAQVMLRFLIQKGLIVIPKSVNPSRIGENIKIFDFKLDSTDMVKLENLDKRIRVCTVDAFKGIENHPEFPF